MPKRVPWSPELQRALAPTTLDVLLVDVPENEVRLSSPDLFSKTTTVKRHREPRGKPQSLHVSIREASAMLRCSRATIGSLIAQRDLHLVDAGKSRKRLLRKAVEDLANRGWKVEEPKRGTPRRFKLP